MSVRPYDEVGFEFGEVRREVVAHRGVGEEVGETTSGVEEEVRVRALGSASSSSDEKHLVGGQGPKRMSRQRR